MTTPRLQHALTIGTFVSMIVACRGVPERADAGRRDADRRDAASEPSEDDAFVSFPFDAPGLGDLDAPFDTGPGETPCFEDVATEIGLGDPFGPYRRPPECRFDDPAHDGPGDHCDAEWGLAGAAVGDVNGDGHDDLFVTRIDRGPSLYVNDGTGRFTDEAAARGLAITEPTAAAAFGDVDADGDLDLYVATFGGLAHHLFLNEGASFRDVAVARGAAIASMRPLLGSSVTFGDYDGDGDLDLFVGEWRFHTVHDGPSNARLLRNRGPTMPGYFEDVTLAAGVAMEDAWTGVAMPGVYVYAVAMLDLDDDGNVDLAVNGDFRTSRLFFGRGDGTFVDGTRAAGVGTETNAMGASFADLDDDGDLDWLVTSIWMAFGPDWGNRLFRNDGARRFTEITREAGVLESGWAWGAVFFDHDNDRDYDLAIANGWDFAPHADDAMRFYRNEGALRFVDVASRVGIDDRTQTRGVVVFDPDDDGDLDLFVARQGATPSLFRNACGEGHAWLRVRVRGGDGALGEGLGARVTVRESATSAPRTFVIGQSTHYQGQSERIAHFGLGDHAGTIAEVRVELPDGRSVTRTDVASREVLEITVP
ncbi:MAG: CRTAC1 family protein [Deltaproteobacteria bacterium]|nr:CRTAC1 family protein [Deltaproteobacteria bacterium]